MKSNTRIRNFRWTLLAALVGLAPNLHGQTTTNGLVVYLNFDNNISAQAGTTVNGVIYPQSSDPNAKYTTGVIGQAAFFSNDGSGGQPSDWAVQLQGSLESVYSNSFSYSLWVNTASTTDATIFGNKDWNSGANIGWNLNTTDGKNLNWNAAGGTRRDIGLNPPFSDSNWHLLSVTWDRLANTVLVYLDGLLHATSDISPNGSASMNAGYPTLIGSSGSGNYSGAATIDDLAIWSRVVSPEEVVAIYAKGTAGKELVSQLSPSFVQQPQGATRYAGESYLFSCLVADDRGPVSYQWYKDGGKLTNAISSRMLLTGLTNANAGSYTVVATDPIGSITSAPAALVVLPVNSISNALTVYLNFDNNIAAQAGTTNGGTAVGTAGLPQYATGQIANCAVFTNDPNGSGITDWAVSLGDIEWVYSNNWSFSLWVKTADTLGALFGNKDWNSGGNVGWLISEYRTDFLNYRAQASPQYNIGKYNWADGEWHYLSTVFDRDQNLVSVYVDANLTATAPLGITGNESLTPANILTTLVGSSGNGNYSAFGQVDDLGVWVRTLTPPEILAIFVQGLNGQPLPTASPGAIRPLVISQPKDETRIEGLPTAFSVTSIGSLPLSYQWRRNGVNLPGETNSTLVFPPAALDSGAGYTAVVTNQYGSTTSSPPAILTVIPGPAAITNGLVVYLNFDSNIVAQAGTTNSGTPIGDVGIPAYTNGIIGAAALFENDPNGSGSTDWAVSLGDIESVYSNNWSFSLWVKTTDNLGALLGNKDWNSGANIGWLISEYYTDFLNYRAQDSPRHDIGNFNWANDKWHQVAAVFYRDANLVYTYVDGALTAQAPLGLTGLESLTSPDIVPNATLVGSSGNASYSGYGSIDDLGIWTRPLPSADILAIYQAGLAGRGLTQVTRQQPTLYIALSGTNVVITYPASAATYTLQSTPSLSPVSWTAVGVTPSISNGTATVTLPINQPNRYLRLQQ